MKIVILGAGQVGGSLAEHLVSENTDITLVDINADRLRYLQNKLDIGTVAGHAAHPATLQQAGLKHAQLLIAATNSDEINMVACQVAFSLFNTPKKIARLRATAYLVEQALFDDAAIPIDAIISPELLVTRYIQRLIHYPSALQVLNFAEGKVRLVAVKAYHGGPIVGHALAEISQHIPNIDMRVAAIFRRNHPIFPQASTVIETGDEVFFIAARDHILPVMSEMRRIDNPYQRIMIAGGGNIGGRLANALEKNYQVKIIEHDYARCRALSEQLDHTIVLNGNASDRDLLVAEDIANVDVFCAVTNNDEANIMSSMLAKRLGAGKVITLILKPAYVDLVQGGTIDIAVSPQQITTGGLLNHVRPGDISNVYPLRHGAAEAMEVTVHGNKHSSKVVGRRLDSIPIPEEVTIGAVVRGETVLMPHHDLVVETNDHLILFLLDKSKTTAIEQLFQERPGLL